jgi:copper chaperone CopZ
MSDTTFPVSGLTCGHCVVAVTRELNLIDSVSSVHIDLRPGAISTVTVSSSAPLSPAEVAAALDEAGDYRLAS